MCYNCGCGMLDNDMGNKDNLTQENFKKSAKAAFGSDSPENIKESKQNTLNALKKELGE